MPPRKSWGRNAFICDAVGSHLIEGQLRKLQSKLHIFGHTHISWDSYWDGTHYLQNAVRYPQERIAWKSRVDEIQKTGDLRNILVWSSSDPHNFCAWPGRCGKCELSKALSGDVCPPSRVDAPAAGPAAAAAAAASAAAEDDPGCFTHRLPAAAGYFDDDDKHEWAALALPTGWAGAYGGGRLDVRWRDQGWGSQKGLLYGRLVQAGRAQPWSQLSTGFAPQRWMAQSFPLPTAWFDPPSGASASSPPRSSGTTTLELAFVVGGKADGTGHQLQVQDGGTVVLQPRQPAALPVVS